VCVCVCIIRGIVAGRKEEMDNGAIFLGRCTERTTNSRHISGLFDIQRVHKIDCAQPCSFCIMPGREISIQDVDFSGPPITSLPRFISYTLDIFAAVKRTYEIEIELGYRAYITRPRRHFFSYVKVKAVLILKSEKFNQIILYNCYKGDSF